MLFLPDCLPQAEFRCLVRLSVVGAIPTLRQPQRGGVHAVAFAGGAGAVGEDMA